MLPPVGGQHAEQMLAMARNFVLGETSDIPGSEKNPVIGVNTPYSGESRPGAAPSLRPPALAVNILGSLRYSHANRE